MSFLIPLVNKGESASAKDNLLWMKDKIFVMDNHRLALWCWFQVLKKNQRYNLWHIDAHPDLSESALQNFSSDLSAISLEDYRKVWQQDTNTPLFRWDNYLEVFLKKCPEYVGHTISSTHHIGSKKELSQEVSPFHLVSKFDEIFSGKKYLNELPWIVNLDIDYFFSAQPEKLELFSDDYVKALSSSIKKGLDSGMIAVLTIALSPECCGSWAHAIKLLEKLNLTPELVL